MWHPTDPTHPGKWNDGQNVSRLARLDRPIRCAAGLAPSAEESEKTREADAATVSGRRRLQRARRAA
jgi:hypothetical protein